MNNRLSLRVFLLGMLWSVLSSLAPVAVILLDWTRRWSDPPDRTMLGHLALTCAIGGAVSFWRKHRALLSLPPWLQTARDLNTAAAATAAESGNLRTDTQSSVDSGKQTSGGM